MAIVGGHHHRLVVSSFVAHPVKVQALVSHLLLPELLLLKLQLLQLPVLLRHPPEPEQRPALLADALHVVSREAIDVEVDEEHDEARDEEGNEGAPDGVARVEVQHTPAEQKLVVICLLLFLPLRSILYPA